MEKLKGLILSGGAGTRLRPITHTSAKQLVPVANKPVLFYGIEALVEAGVTEIGIVIAPETGDEIRAAVGDGSALGAEVTYIPQASPDGLAHAVLTAEAYLGDSPFVMYLGDNLLRDGITSLTDAFREHEPDALILLTPVARPRGLRRRRARRQPGRPPDREAGRPAVGSRAGRRLHVHLEGLRRSPRDRALAARRARDHRHDPAADRRRAAGRAPIGSTAGGRTPASSPTCSRPTGSCSRTSSAGSTASSIDSEVEGRVVVEAGARLERTTVRGPAVIGAGAHVADAYIGPYTAIGPGCEVTGTEIEHSILLSGARGPRPRRPDGGEPARPRRQDQPRRRPAEDAADDGRRQLRADAPVRVMVVGAGGMLGQEVTDACRRRGHDVEPLTRTSSTSPTVRADRPRRPRDRSRHGDQLRRLVRRRRRRGRRARRDARQRRGRGGPRRLGGEHRRHRAVYPSSDYVFDGRKREPVRRIGHARPARRLRALEARRRDLGRGRQPEPLHRPHLLALRPRRHELRRDDAEDRRRAAGDPRRQRPARLPDQRHRPRRRPRRRSRRPATSASTTSPAPASAPGSTSRRRSSTRPATTPG